LFAAISFIKVIVSGESLGLLECVFDLCFQNTRKSSRWKPQQHQEKPIPFSVDRSFDLATKDDQLVSYLTFFGKEARSIVLKMPIFRTDVPSSQHTSF
jgi:hypothetical protein